ncbi:histidine kinase N-terminal 7TM domain-containing protein [Natronorubrum halophilum]|uniref:histidine kinase N-terminal 7TM domain-containing protein n=1 Tax=Natronorubrum halophilum TaxID=1702106 RepID=UPI000EF71EA0|nr:histidine kinase N-terminal 7TM domain-containing protein [Natronorubrum halophilum]
MASYYPALQWTPHTPVLVASFVVCTALTFAGWRYRNQSAAFPFTVMMLGCALYTGTVIVEFSVVGLESTLFWARLQYLGWVVITPAAFVFVLSYTGRNRWVTLKLFAALAVVPVVTLLLVFSPLASDLIFQNPRMVDNGGIAYLAYDAGPWYVADGLYNNVVIALGFVLLVRTYFRTTIGQRDQVGVLVIGLLPYVTLVPFYYHVGPAVFDFGTPYEIEPFLFTFTGSIFAWALYKYQFLESVPVPFELLLEATPNGIFAVDNESRITEFNRTACEYLDMTEPIIGQPLATLSEPAERVDAIIADEREPELRIGNDVYHVSASQLTDSQGVEHGRMVVIQDVTERVQYDRLLERHNEQLETLNQMLRHDIRNDTMVALGWSEVLAELVEETPLEEETVPLLDYIDTSIRHITDLTKIASELSQPLERPGDDWNRSIPLQQVLKQEVEKAAEAFPDAVFTLEDPPDIEVTADRALASAVSNVLRNAVLHNDKEIPRVDISVDVDGDRVSVRIADNGPGIPPEMRERIFERGVKGKQSGGTGLGLHLVQTFMTWYDGSIEVEDNDPTGTVFTIELPVVE